MVVGVEGSGRAIREHDTPMAPGKKLMVNVGPKVDQAFYQSCIGTLLYLSGWTRPDLAFSISTLSKYITNPGLEHHEALMHLIGYVKRTKKMRITYGREPREGVDFGINELGGYVDAAFACDYDTRKSKTGFVLFLNGGPVAWKSKDQSIVALSSTDSEVDAAVRAIREVKGIRVQLFGLNLEQRKPTVLYEDNSATICISHSASLRETTKHLGYRRGFLRDEVAGEEGGCFAADFNVAADGGHFDESVAERAQREALRGDVRDLGGARNREHASEESVKEGPRP